MLQRRFAGRKPSTDAITARYTSIGEFGTIDTSRGKKILDRGENGVNKMDEIKLHKQYEILSRNIDILCRENPLNYDKKQFWDDNTWKDFQKGLWVDVKSDDDLMPH